MSEIQKTIINRTKETLNIQEEISIFDLYDVLYKTRNASHPDLFGEEQRKQATEKFSNLNNLLKEFKIYIDNQKLNEVGTNLIIHRENYENVINKNQIIILESEISSLKQNLKEKSEEIDSLKFQIKNLNDEELMKLEKDLKDLYKPKKNSIWFLGITATLILLINLLVQITKLKDNFVNLFPIRIEWINIILFIVFIFLSIKILMNNIYLERIKKIAEELKTNDKIQQFLNIYVDLKKDKYTNEYTTDVFTESEVERFVKIKFFSKKIKLKKNYLMIY